MKDTNEKTMVSARVNAAAVKMVKNMRVPLSDVIEAGIMHFLLLDDFTKLKFMIQNDEAVTLGRVLQKGKTGTTKNWSDLVKESLNLENDVEAKLAMRELTLVAKNLEDRGEEMILKKHISSLDVSSLLQKANLLMLRSNFGGALTFYESALNLLSSEANNQDTAKTQVMIGKCHQYLGRYSESLIAYEKAHRIFEQRDMKPELAEVLLEQGTCYQMIRMYEEAYTLFNYARLLFEELENVSAVCRAFSSMIACLSVLGDKNRITKVYALLIDFVETQKKNTYTELR